MHEVVGSMKKKSKAKRRVVKMKRIVKSSRPTCAANASRLNDIEGIMLQHSHRITVLLTDLKDRPSQREWSDLQMLLDTFDTRITQLKNEALFRRSPDALEKTLTTFEDQISKHSTQLRKLKFDHTGLKDFRSDVRRDGDDLALEVEHLKKSIAKLEHRQNRSLLRRWSLRLWSPWMGIGAKI